MNDSLHQFREAHRRAQVMRDGIAGAMADIVAEGHVPSERMVDEYRIAKMSERMAFEALTEAMSLHAIAESSTGATGAAA